MMQLNIPFTSFSGSRPQYYVGEFIASNEDVDAHLNDIGYETEVTF